MSERPVRVITIRSQVREVSQRWDEQYSRHGSSAQGQIGKRLAEIDTETATAAEVAAIIGNDTWVCSQECHECGGFFDVVVKVGQESDYESCTASLCAGCLRRALAALKGDGYA